MMNPTNLNVLAFRGYPQLKVNDTVNPDKTDDENNIATSDNTNENKVMSFKASEALKSYNYTTNPMDINAPMSMQDYKNKLNTYGLVEGVNYDTIGENIFVQNNKGQLSKVISWQDGQGKENYAGYADVTYPDNENIECIHTEYDKDGNFVSKNTQYKSINENNLPDGFTLNTGKNEYLENLKTNGINYVTETQETDNMRYSTIVETDNNGNVVKDTCFMNNPKCADGECIMHTVSDSNGFATKTYLWCPQENTMSIEEYSKQ